MNMKNYEERYNKLIEAIKVLQETNPSDVGIQNWVNDNVPELQESEDERIRKQIIAHFRNTRCVTEERAERIAKWIAWLEKQKKPEDKGEISDGYHTFNELYKYRMLYNAAFFNLLPKHMVHKSKRHHDGEECFGGGWFIVMANLPTGQISNHYELKDWDLFQIPEKDVADEWDGHTSQDAAYRLHSYLLKKQYEQNVSDSSNTCKIETLMTLDKAIEHCKEKSCDDTVCSKEHKQLAEWLTELKSYRVSTNKETQNTAYKIEPKFHPGDWIVDKSGFTQQVLDFSSGIYTCTYNSFTTDCESNYHLWTIQDAKDGDVLANDYHILILKELVYNWSSNGTPDSVKAYCGIKPNGNFEIGKDNWCFCGTLYIHPATKEQCDILFHKMKEEGYEWDAEKKELKMSEKLKILKAASLMSDDILPDKLIDTFRKDLGL